MGTVLKILQRLSALSAAFMSNMCCMLRVPASDDQARRTAYSDEFAMHPPATVNQLQPNGQSITGGSRDGASTQPRHENAQRKSVRGRLYVTYVNNNLN